MLSSLIPHNNEQFLNQIIMWDKKWILYHNWKQPAQWLDRKEVPKHLWKSNLHQKKGHGPCLVDLVPIWSTTAFWILANPLYLRSMLIKSTRCTKNCNACSRHWSTERAQHHTTNTSEVEQTGLWSFASSTIFTWPLNNWLPCTSSSISKLFAGKTLPQPAECRKFFPRVHWISKHGFLCYSNK